MGWGRGSLEGQYPSWGGEWGGVGIILCYNKGEEEKIYTCSIISNQIQVYSENVFHHKPLKLAIYITNCLTLISPGYFGG